MFAWSPVYLPSPVIYLSIVSFWAADILAWSRRGSCEGSCEFSHHWTTTCRSYLTGLLFSSLLGCFTLGLYVYKLSSCFSMRWWPLWSKYNISDTGKHLRQQPFGCVSHSGIGTSAAHAQRSRIHSRYHDSLNDDIIHMWAPLLPGYPKFVTLVNCLWLSQVELWHDSFAINIHACGILYSRCFVGCIFSYTHH